MTGLEVAILTAAAFFTAILSAVLGMGGGMTLMVVMLQFLDPLLVIPLHGAVQLISNTSRVAIQRKHIRRGVVLCFAILLLPAGLLTLPLAKQIPRDGLRLAIGVLVLAFTWLPRARSSAESEAPVPTPRLRFLGLGAGAGALNVTVGATGPLIAPFFLNLGLTRHEVIGTKAACQVCGHTAKLIVFGLAGFAFQEYLLPLSLLGLAVIGGTLVGSRLLNRVSERAFVRLYKTLLTLLALRIVLTGAWRLYAA